jgi:hypothetical protein
VQVLGAAREVLLHQRQTEALGDAALDLALDQGRVDGLADVVGRHHAQHLHRAELEVDLDNGNLGGEGIGRVGNALAVGVERRRRRIEGALAHQRTRCGEIDHPHLAAVAHREPGAVERQHRVRPGIGQTQDLAAQVAAGAFGCHAGDEGLARGRGLAGIGGEVGVARDQGKLRGGQTQRISRDLGHDGVGALADVDRPAVERERAGRRQADPHARRVGHRGVADAVPHAAHADAAPLGPSYCIERSDLVLSLAPVRLQRFQALGEAGGMGQRLAGRRGVADTQRIAQAELQAIDAERVGQLVHHRLMGDGGLRHAETAESAGRRGVGEPGIAPGAHVGHTVGTHGVHRHAVGDGWPPRGIGAGVEVGRHLAGQQPALAIAAEPGGDARGMALGRGRHAFRPRVDQGDRPAKLPRRHRHQGLDREIELAAEAAAAGRRHDAHRLGPQPHDDRHLVAVHVGRLGRDMDLDAIAHALGPAGLGLDIGVLDEGGLEHVLDHRGAGGKGFVRLAAFHAALQQEIARLVGLDQGRIGRHRGIEADNRRLRRPGDRHVFIADRQHEVALADQGDDGLAAIAHLAVGQHRLVLDVGIDAETVRRHVVRGQHRGEPPAQRIEVTQGEAGPRIGRADDADPQRIGGNAIGAELLAARDLVDAIDPRQPRTDGATGRRRRRQRCLRIHDSIDDLAVARAAAQHATQRILDLAARRPRRRGQKLLGRHQHAGYADAALRRTMSEKRCLQGGQRAVAVAQALDGLDRAAGDLAHGDQAGTDLPLVEQDGAGATVAGIATDLGAGV